MDVFNGNGIIISAERPEFNSEENANRSAAMVAQLIQDVGWDGRIIPCTGSFEGDQEQSYIVLVNEDISDSLELTRELMLDMLLTAYKFSQDAILVFGTGVARLLELPDIEIEGEFSDAELKEALLTVYKITGGDGLVSEPLHFVEVTPEDIETFDLDYTEVAGRYYTLET